MSEHVNKPEAGLKTQEEIKLKVSEKFANADDPVAPNSRDENKNNIEVEKSADVVSEKNENGSSESAACDEEKKLSAQDRKEITQSVSYDQVSSPGLRRHKLIGAACFFASMILLPFSSFDLKHLIEREAGLDNKLNLEFVKPRPDLPPSLNYHEGYRSSEVKNPDLLAVTQSSWKGNLFGFVDKTGKVVVPPKYYNYHDFTEGLAAVKVGPDKDAKWGYIDTTGKMVIEPKYSEAYGFQHGLALVRLDKRMGVINKSGMEILKTEYFQFNWLDNGFIVETARMRSGILGFDGKWKLPPNYSDIRGFEPLDPTVLSSQIISDPRYWEREQDAKLLKIRQNDMYGVADPFGKILITPKYENITSCSDGVAAVSVDGKIGFVNAADASFSIRPQFDSASPYADVIAVKNGSKWSLIDKSGAKLAAPEIESIVTQHNGDWFSDGLGAVVVKRKIGYVNRKGELAIKPEFDIGTPFVNGHALVRSGDRWHVIDRSGDFVPGLEFGSVMGKLGSDMRVTIPGPLYSIVEAQELRSMRMYIKDYLEGKFGYYPGRRRGWY